MASPTREEYEEALKRKKYLSDSIILERRRREKLINELCLSQSCLNSYEVALSDANNIIQKYEIYREIKNE